MSDRGIFKNLRIIKIVFPVGCIKHRSVIENITDQHRRKSEKTVTEEITFIQFKVSDFVSYIVVKCSHHHISIDIGIIIIDPVIRYPSVICQSRITDSYVIPVIVKVYGHYKQSFILLVAEEYIRSAVNKIRRILIASVQCG